MATGSVVNQGKTAFVKEFLASHRDAYHGTVNEAWVAAGNTDSVSESLVSKMRRKLGLTGKKVAKGVAAEKKPVSAAKGKAKSSPKESKGASKAEESPSQPDGGEVFNATGKSAFVQEMLKREPKANVKAINEAWASAGNTGKISDSVIYTIKRELKRGSRPTTASPKAPKAKSPKGSSKTKLTVEARSETKGVTPPSKSVGGSKTGKRERILDRVENSIDDLIIELKQLGGMDEALESLRKVRRVVVRSHGG